jgi:arylsulfatase A-like enzyme
MARWLVPSVVGACAGAIVTGLVESAGGDWYRRAATAGFVSLLAVPALTVASVIVRGLVAAWQPRVVLASLVEPDGSAPRLAGWVAVIWLATLGLAWAMFQGTWLLASVTAFKPLAIGFAAPILGVATMFLIIVMSRPAALWFAWLARKLDGLCPPRGQGTLLAPRLIIGGALYTAFVAGYLIWQLLVLKRMRTLDTEVLIAPVAGVVATIAVHFAWRGPVRLRAIAGAGVAMMAGAAIAVAVHAANSRPMVALAIWADEPVGRHAIEHLFDLEAIRRDAPIAQWRPLARDAVHPDIVLVTITNLRADRTPPYNGPAQMPALRELGQRGSVFAWAFAPTNTARHSIPSIITGVAPNRVRGRLTAFGLWLDPRHVVLAERLRAAGYETAGFVCCKEYFSEEARTGWSRGLEHVVIEEDGLALARAARKWLVERERRPGNRPLFVWMHVGEPAKWLDGQYPRTDDDRRRLYDRSLASADATLVELLGGFAQRAPDRAPITIVTADHGQGLGEHGQRYQSKNLYDPQIHVPLVIAGPNIKPQRVAETVSLVDLVPTIVDLAGFNLSRSPAIDGRSLVELAIGRRTGESTHGTAYATMIDGRVGEGRSAVIRGGWKLIDNGLGFELYDLKADPAERYNLFAQRSQIVGELKTLLTTKQRAAEHPPF